MAFVVDAAEWNFGNWAPDEVIRALEAIVDCVWTALERGEKVWIGDDLQSRAVLGDLCLWDLLNPESPVVIPAELGHELAAWLGKSIRYLDENEWPDGIDQTVIQVDTDPPLENVDQAWAHHHVRMGVPMACLSLKRSGVHLTTSQLGAVSVHWVTNEATHRAFWRGAIEAKGGGAAVLEQLAPHAFPDLFFPPGVWQGLGDFAGGYLAIRTEVARYLAVLDDHGRWAFKFPPPAIALGEPPGGDLGALPSNQIVLQRFQGLALDMAPENPDVWADPVCRQAREIAVNGRTLYCEWHGKLQPHRNRVHVHAPVPETANKLVIAKFHEHLPLP